jgi:DNA-directed RNA polymerase subunit RPC12/RpoP
MTSDLVRWPKVCARCDRSFDERTWRELRLTGSSALTADTRVECRECHCGRIMAAATSDDATG